MRNLRLTELSLPPLSAIELERSRRRHKRSLAEFVHDAWPILEQKAPLRWGWALDAMSEHLMAVSHGRINRLRCHVPPGMMKSLLFSVFWPSWEWGPASMPWMQYLTTSYSQDNVIRDNMKMRKLITSDWYRGLYPDVMLASDQNEKRKFENTRGGFREGRAFGSMTGGRGHRVIIDDPHSTETAESDTERRNTIRIFRESLSDRLNDENSAIVLIMQRLHYGDVSGVITQERMPYVTLCLPMEYEAGIVDRDGVKVDSKAPNELGFIDPRTEEGELLHPDRFGPQYVAEMKAAKGSYAYSGQYQQRPVPREGGMFKREWFEGKLLRDIPAGTRFCRHWDLAATKDGNGARTAGIKLGLTTDGRLIVAHAITTRREGADVRKLIKATAEIDGVDTEISLPQDPGQAGKVQARDFVTMLMGYNVRTEPETGDKATRALPFAAQAEAGNVYLLEGAWNTEYLDELCMFPGGALKDQVDASSGAFGRLMKRNTNTFVVGRYGNG